MDLALAKYKHIKSPSEVAWMQRLVRLVVSRYRGGVHRGEGQSPRAAPEEELRFPAFTNVRGLVKASRAYPGNKGSGFFAPACVRPGQSKFVVGVTDNSSGCIDSLACTTGFVLRSLAALLPKKLMNNLLERRQRLYSGVGLSRRADTKLYFQVFDARRRRRYFLWCAMPCHCGRLAVVLQPYDGAYRAVCGKHYHERSVFLHSEPPVKGVTMQCIKPFSTSSPGHRWSRVGPFPRVRTCTHLSRNRFADFARFPRGSAFQGARPPLISFESLSGDSSRYERVRSFAAKFLDHLFAPIPTGSRGGYYYTPGDFVCCRRYIDGFIRLLCEDLDYHGQPWENTLPDKRIYATCMRVRFKPRPVFRVAVLEAWYCLGQHGSRTWTVYDTCVRCFRNCRFKSDFALLNPNFRGGPDFEEDLSYDPTMHPRELRRIQRIIIFSLEDFSARLDLPVRNVGPLLWERSEHERHLSYLKSLKGRWFRRFREDLLNTVDLGQVPNFLDIYRGVRPPPQRGPSLRAPSGPSGQRQTLRPALDLVHSRVRVVPSLPECVVSVAPATVSYDWPVVWRVAPRGTPFTLRGSLRPSQIPKPVVEVAVDKKVKKSKKQVKPKAVTSTPAAVRLAVSAVVKPPATDSRPRRRKRAVPRPPKADAAWYE